MISLKNEKFLIPTSHYSGPIVHWLVYLKFECKRLWEPSEPPGLRILEAFELVNLGIRKDPLRWAPDLKTSHWGASWYQKQRPYPRKTRRLHVPKPCTIHYYVRIRVPSPLSLQHTWKMAVFGQECFVLWSKKHLSSTSKNASPYTNMGWKGRCIRAHSPEPKFPRKF